MPQVIVCDPYTFVDVKFRSFSCMYPLVYIEVSEHESGRSLLNQCSARFIFNIRTLFISFVDNFSLAVFTFSFLSVLMAGQFLRLSTTGASSYFLSGFVIHILRYCIFFRPVLKILRNLWNDCHLIINPIRFFPMFFVLLPPKDCTMWTLFTILCKISYSFTVFFCDPVCLIRRALAVVLAHSKLQVLYCCCAPLSFNRLVCIVFSIM